MNTILEWLLNGDPSIAFLVKRDLLNNEKKFDQNKIGQIGWCADYIKKRGASGSWTTKFYQPKWISTHYTLLELRNLAYKKNDRLIQEEIKKISLNERGIDGGINPAKTIQVSDVCVNGMFLNYAAYFEVNEEIIKNIVDFILSQRMSDGGYNCNLNQIGAKHSSLHSTICVLEGFQSYLNEGYTYRKKEIKQSQETCVDFILRHNLFKSCHTGQVIDSKFLKLTYPFRWKYTILRSLNCFVDMNIPYDARMEDAIAYIENKTTKNGLWKLQSKFSGQEYFDMEEVGKPSRMITYFALKILKHYRNFNPLFLEKD